MPHARYLLARGPFLEAGRTRIASRDYGIDAIVAKNSGGKATYGKIAAARALGIDVILVRRPALPEVDTVETVDDAVTAVDHWLAAVNERGV